MLICIQWISDCTHLLQFEQIPHWICYSKILYNCYIYLSVHSNPIIVSNYNHYQIKWTQWKQIMSGKAADWQLLLYDNTQHSADYPDSPRQWELIMAVFWCIITESKRQCADRIECSMGKAWNGKKRKSSLLPKNRTSDKNLHIYIGTQLA